ncbi:uncharacterized protein VTP21DRAFT_11592 [Calcarisporiella thermophila]|uniref:uncharacterized protein n=1 Tax=Calcarisporiella thermophila TaxID=911321 RepID=UPI0037449982
MPKRARTKNSEEEGTKKRVAFNQQSSATPLLPPAKTLLERVTAEDFRIVAGCYERILYGVDGYWQTNEDDALTLKLEPIFIFPAHTGCLKSLAIGGQYLASGSSDEQIRLYNLRLRKELGTLMEHQGSITTLEFHSKTHLISGSEDGLICIWRSKDWECLKKLKGHKGRINSLAIHPSGKIALSVSSDRTVILWNLMTGRKANSLKLKTEGEVVKWNQAGTHYAILSDRTVDIYETSSPTPNQTLRHRSRFLCMKYYAHPTLGDLILTGHEDRKVRIWRSESGECIRELSGHKGRVKALDVVCSTPNLRGHSQLHNVLVTCSSDGVIRAWDLDNEVMEQESGDMVALAEYNTKSRLTCISVTLGYRAKAGESKGANDEDEDGEEEKERTEGGGGSDDDEEEEEEGEGEGEGEEEESEEEEEEESS